MHNSAKFTGLDLTQTKLFCRMIHIEQHTTHMTHTPPLAHSLAHSLFSSIEIYSNIIHAAIFLSRHFPLLNRNYSANKLPVRVNVTVYRRECTLLLKILFPWVIISCATVRSSTSNGANRKKRSMNWLVATTITVMTAMTAMTTLVDACKCLCVCVYCVGVANECMCMA